MKNLALLAVLVLFGTSAVWAQDETDVLRYSQLSFGGTARSGGMSGAFGSLGGDMSVMSFNPAGIAVYRKSEFSMSLGFTSMLTESSYEGVERSDSDPNINIGNVGFVGAGETDGGSKWRYIHFGFAYQRLQNYSGSTLIEGTVNGTSLLDVYTNSARGVDPDFLYDDRPYSAGLAYNAFLIDPVDSTGSEYTSQLYAGDVEQSMRMYTRGRAAETSIAFGGNYDDIIYVGGSLNFPGARYLREYVYTETAMDTSLALREYTYIQNLETSGSGFNAKLGIIVRPVDFLRVGLAFHTPTYMSFTDQYSTSINSYFRTGSGYSPSYEATSPEGRFDYRITTPSRIIASASGVIGKMGLVSVDYEYIDYSSARLRASNNRFATSSYNFTNENAQVNAQYVATGNLRVGTEWRVNPMRIRAGVAMYGNPYKENATLTDPTRTSISGGLGYRTNEFYIDFAAVHTTYSDDFYLYDAALVNAATLDHTQLNFLLTVGFRY